MVVVTSLLLTIHITTVSQMPCCLWLNICWWRQTSNTPWITRKLATPTPDLQVLVSFYWPDVAEQFSKISPAMLKKRYAFSSIVLCIWCSIWTLFLNSFEFCLSSVICCFQCFECQCSSIRICYIFCYLNTRRKL